MMLKGWSDNYVLAEVKTYEPTSVHEYLCKPLSESHLSFFFYRINQMAVTTTKQFLPIDSQIKQVNDLLSSNYEGDIDKGFELIDRLQSRLGVDLGKYSKEIGDSVQKLYDMNRQRKEDKAEAERIRVEKTQ